MAEAIRKKFGIQPELIESGGGAFEVCIDGRKIFSKLELGRFPEREEIFKAIEGARA